MEVKYYSFKTGFYGQKQSEWILQDLKIPAVNVKEAVITYFWHREFQTKVSNKWMMRKSGFEFPSQQLVHMTIRQAIEYTVARKYGYFMVQYKKQRIITSNEILSYFK